MKVGDQFRTNNLSLIPGGSVIRIEYVDRNPLEYDKIKSTKGYANTMISRLKRSGEISGILSITDDKGNVYYKK